MSASRIDSAPAISLVALAPSPVGVASSELWRFSVFFPFMATFSLGEQLFDYSREPKHRAVASAHLLQSGSSLVRGINACLDRHSRAQPIFELLRWIDGNSHSYALWHLDEVAGRVVGFEHSKLLSGSGRDALDPTGEWGIRQPVDGK